MPQPAGSWSSLVWPATNDLSLRYKIQQPIARVLLGTSKARLQHSVTPPLHHSGPARCWCRTSGKPYHIDIFEIDRYTQRRFLLSRVWSNSGRRRQYTI